MQIHDWLQQTKAGDIMVSDVTKISAGDTLAAAAMKLLHEGISGAPVVDEANTCVGVLSASDIIGAEEKVAEEQSKIAESTFWRSDLILPAHIYAEKLAEIRDKISPAAEQPVERFMTKDLVTAAPDTPLQTIVRHMVDAHVHRVLIMDDSRQLLGIISTTDVLAALMNVRD